MIRSMANGVLILFSPSGVIGRDRYVALGLVFFAIKFPIDWIVAHQFGVRWTPLSYLIWPGHDTLALWQLPPSDRMLAIALLV